MLQTIPISQIKQRASAISLSLKVLAGRAGIAASTAYDGANGSHETRRSTEDKIGRQLVDAELRLLAHLAALHPQEAMQAATVALCQERPAVAPQREAAQ